MTSSHLEFNTKSWQSIQSSLRASLGEAAFINWIEPLILSDINGTSLALKAPTKFIGDWVNRNYSEQIKTECHRFGIKIDRLKFITQNNASPTSKQKNTPAIKLPKNKTTEKPFLGSRLDKRFIFDNFVVGQTNMLAHAAARRIIESKEIAFNPLFLHSNVGLGKTHLMHAIAWGITNRNPDSRVLYLSAEQFMFRFIQAIRFKDTLSFKEIFHEIDVLLIDDVQFIAGKKSTQEEFFHTFNTLIDQGKQVIISADRTPNDIENLQERIKSRLQGGLVVDIHPANYELRLGILKSKQKIKARQNPDTKMVDGVLEFIAQNISTNVRVLEGALNRLYAFGDLIGQPITLDMAQENLSDILRSTKKDVTIDDIMRIVVTHYTIELSDILGPARTRSIARPRQIAMYLCKQFTTKSLPEIGKRFGKRDHTTVIHAVKKIENLLETDQSLSHDITTLRCRLSRS